MFNYWFSWFVGTTSVSIVAPTAFDTPNSAHLITLQINQQLQHPLAETWALQHFAEFTAKSNPSSHNTPGKYCWMFGNDCSFNARMLHFMQNEITYAAESLSRNGTVTVPTGNFGSVGAYVHNGLTVAAFSSQRVSNIDIYSGAHHDNGTYTVVAADSVATVDVCDPSMRCIPLTRHGRKVFSETLLQIPRFVFIANKTMRYPSLGFINIAL